MQQEEGEKEVTMTKERKAKQREALTEMRWTTKIKRVIESENFFHITGWGEEWWGKEENINKGWKNGTPWIICEEERGRVKQNKQKNHKVESMWRYEKKTAQR